MKQGNDASQAPPPACTLCMMDSSSHGARCTLREKAYTQSDSTGAAWRVLKLTHQGAAPMASRRRDREYSVPGAVYLAKLHVFRYEEKARKIQFSDYPSVIMRR